MKTVIILKGSRVFKCIATYLKKAGKNQSFSIVITNVAKDRSLTITHNESGSKKTLTEAQIRSAVADYLRTCNVKRIISLNGYVKFGEVNAPKFQANFWANGDDIAVMKESKVKAVAKLIAKANGKEVTEVVTAEPPSASKEATNTGGISAEQLAEIVANAVTSALEAVK